MVVIKGKEYAPKITISILLRYASVKGIGISKIQTLLEDITPADLVGVFVFAVRAENYDLSDKDVWEEMDNNINILADIANLINISVDANIPEEEQAKKKTVKK